MRSISRLLTRLPIAVALGAVTGMPAWLALHSATKSVDEARSTLQGSLELQAELERVVRADRERRSGSIPGAHGAEPSEAARFGLALQPGRSMLTASPHPDPGVRTRGDAIKAATRETITSSDRLHASVEPRPLRAFAQLESSVSTRTQLDLSLEEQARKVQPRGDAVSKEAAQVRAWKYGAIALTLVGLAAVTALALRLERLRATGEAELRRRNWMLARRISERSMDTARTSVALRETEESYRLLFDTVPLACWVYDLETLEMLAANAGACELFGYSHAEILELTVIDLIDPEEREFFTRQILEKIREQPLGRSRVVSSRLRRRNGDALHLELHAVTAVLHGRRVRQVIGRDVMEELTAQRALETKEMLLRAMVDVIPAVMSVRGGDGRYLLVNPAWTRVTGVSEQEAVGRRTRDLEHLPKESSAAIDRQVTHVLETGMVCTAEHRETALPGAPLLLLTRFPIRDASGAFIGVGTVGTDITAIRAAEEHARAAAERIEKLSRSLMEVEENERRAIARELHDELGQSLSALKLNLQALLQRAACASDRETLEDSIELAEHVIKCVRHVSSSLRPTALDDLGLVPALQGYLDRQAARAGISCTFDATEYDGALDATSRTACFRIVQEAVANALKHARARHLHVRLCRQADEVLAEIHDDGMGCDVEQARAASRAGKSGGLTSMAERAALVGGALEIESEGSGTCVRARLPVTRLSTA